MVRSLVEDGAHSLIPRISQEDATTEELQNLKERLATMERHGIHPEEVSNDEEESTKEAKP